MQTPPPFQGFEGQPTQKKPKPKTLVIVLAILGTLTLCCGVPIAFFAFFLFKGYNGAMAMVECGLNVDAMGKAVQTYASKNNGKLPPAKSWQTDIAPYLSFDKSKGDGEQLMNLWTKEGEWSCGRKSKTGFAFNEAMSGKKLADIAAKDATAVIVFETTKVGYNAHAPYKALPFADSPVMFEGLMDEKRGWAVVTASGKVGFLNKKGGISDPAEFSNSKSGIKIDSSSSSNSE